ncbi:MAG: RNA polymerase sigma factor [Bacteroidota bacterium]
MSATPCAERLFRDFRSGNEGALAGLHALLYDRMLRYGLATVNRRPLVEDAIQDVFVELLLKQDQLAEVRKVELYLLAAVRRRLYDRLRRENRRGLRAYRYLTGTETGLEVRTADLELLLEETVRLRRESLARQLAQLSPRQREVLHLRFYEDLSYPEIAEIMAIRPQVARNYGSRALSLLRVKLREWREELRS